ncbi:alpha 1,2-mannosyltransferase 2.4.1 [Orbilia blumenaviensis]|uniref:Alpha 1,2-mannosyltransferase 2.4.1 n=1 Tax=Orbilia blumenaviensis TaxID=1796055 RepID=A0AAV9UNA3_9PEZI
MPATANVRTLRFILLAFFSIVVLYKIFTSTSTNYNPTLNDLPSPGGGSDLGKVPPRLPKTELSSGDPKGDSEDEQSPLLHGTTPNAKNNFPLTGTAPGRRANATFITLARNSDTWEIAKSIRHIEDRFNRKFNYDWVFLNDQPFDEQFKKITTRLVSGKTKYGLIPKEHWSFPEWIDQDKAAAVREDMRQRKIIYGDSVSYRHMCRFESGFFFEHELLAGYEYYWRVEPSIKLFCDIDYDPFLYMQENKKKYGFTLSLYEYKDTIPTLWDTTKKFMAEYPHHIVEDNSMKFISDNDGKDYNNCHFWSNFEIGSLNWLRSPAYRDYFKYLDKAGGFFYERWGDAPVHSLAASLLLKKDELHFFDNIAYWHVPFTHCPTSEEDREKYKCSCNPKDNFDWKGYSCTSRYFEMRGWEKPKGWEYQMN